MCSKISYFLSSNSSLDKKGLEEVTCTCIHIVRKITLMRIWSLNMKDSMKIIITEMWTPDFYYFRIS